MNLPKFRVVGDPKNYNKRFSTDIIVESLNKGARNVGLFDENGKTVVYDCLGSGYEDVYKNIAAKIVCYEAPFPDFVIRNCQNKPIICVSRDNMRFALDGGYPPHLTHYINLGVDVNIWKPVEKKYLLDKFVVLSYTESLARSGLEILLEAFKLAFKGDDSCVLFVKDRNATPEFKKYIDTFRPDINIKYEDRHIGDVDSIREMFSYADVHAYINRSSTWAMTLTESMSCGLPIISPIYSGPAEYLRDGFTGFGVDYELSKPAEEIEYLKSLGMRNFMFPFRSSDYWCKPSVESLAKVLKTAKDNPRLRKKIGLLSKKKC
jgi:glycosyltransferase involved in cell wall biosynthesis